MINYGQYSVLDDRERDRTPAQVVNPALPLMSACWIQCFPEQKNNTTEECSTLVKTETQ